MIKFTLKYILHYTCPSCNNWWSYATTEEYRPSCNNWWSYTTTKEHRPTEATCPHCGHHSEVTE